MQRRSACAKRRSSVSSARSSLSIASISRSRRSTCARAAGDSDSGAPSGALRPSRAARAGTATPRAPTARAVAAPGGCDPPPAPCATSSGRAAPWSPAGGSDDSGSISFADNTHSQRASSRSVFPRSSRPRSAFACAGSARRTSNPRAFSSRHTYRQPIVASIATAASLPPSGIAHSSRSSRVAPKRRSLISPVSTSNTAA
jgi:hypothetical protein